VSSDLPWENPLPEFRGRNERETLKAYLRERSYALDLRLKFELLEWEYYLSTLEGPKPEISREEVLDLLRERRLMVARREKALRSELKASERLQLEQEAAHVRCA